MGEITVIALLALIFIGPKKLPELASGLGKLIREIRKTTADVKNEIQLDEAIRKPFEELREAVTLHPEELKRRDRLRRELEEATREAEKILKEAQAAEAARIAAGGEPAAEASPTEGSNGALGAEAAPSNGAGDAIPASAAAPGSGPQSAGGGRVSLSSVPPAGTVPRGPSGGLPPSPRRPPGGLDPAAGRPTSSRDSLQGALPPPVDSAADRSNTTQSLSEADLAAIGVTGSTPPPPPLAARLGRTFPPPSSFPPPSPSLPGTTPRAAATRKTGANPAAVASSTKSVPEPPAASEKAPPVAGDKKPESAT